MNAYAWTCSPSFASSALPHEQRRCRSSFVSPYLPLRESIRVTDGTVLTMEPAGARDVHGSTKRLSNEMARLPVVGRVPVHGLVLDFFQGGLPASPFAGRRFLGG